MKCKGWKESYSEVLGGKGQIEFRQEAMVYPSEMQGEMLQPLVGGFEIRCGKYIDGISIVLNHQHLQEGPSHRWYVEHWGSELSDFHGGNGGKLMKWAVPQNQRIAKIYIRSGKYIDGLQFQTSKGQLSPYFGGDGGTLSVIDCHGQELGGIGGSCGKYLDSIYFAFWERK